jgi:hypothetical protein
VTFGRHTGESGGSFELPTRSRMLEFSQAGLFLGEKAKPR